MCQRSLNGSNAEPLPAPKSCASAKQKLDDLLGCMDVIRADIEHYVRSSIRESGTSVDESTFNEDALTWINIRLEDIAATLVGISLHQTPKTR